MRHFSDLPDELLLKVATDLRDSPNGQIHLAKLALVSRQTYPVALEVLYRSPDLTSPIPIAAFDRVGEADGGLPRTALFLRTLLGKPSLARKVQHLEASTFDRPVDHSTACLQCNAELQNSQFECRCSWDDLRSYVTMGQEPGLLGAILGLLPRLKTLTACSFAISDHYHESNKSRDIVYVPTHVPCMAMFGTILKPAEAALVPGLANLEALTSNHIVSSALIHLPRLRTLEFEIDAAQRLVPDSMHCASVNSVLTNLIVHVGPSSFLEWGTSVGTGKFYLGDLLLHLTCIRYLCLQVTTTEEMYEDALPPAYDNLLQGLKSDSLQTLIIDVSEMGSPAHLFNLWHRVLPIGSFVRPGTACQFPGLRRLVVPQDALVFIPAYRYEPNMDPIPETFSPSIECIEIIDSTKALNAFAKDIVEDRSTFPNLREIKLWCDTLDAPLDQYDSYLDDPNPYVDVAQLQPFRVEDSVWDVLQDMGITITKITKKGHGWRELSDRVA